MDNYNISQLIIERGNGGVFGTGYSSYGDKSTTCNTTYYDRRISPYYGDLIQGGYVLDKLGLVDHDDFVKWVMDCPLLDISLKSDQINKFDKVPEHMVGPGVQGAYLGIVALHASGACSLDKVGLGLYIDYWRQKGAAVGRRVGGVIIWEACKNKNVIEKTESIPSFDKRWENAR